MKMLNVEDFMKAQVTERIKDMRKPPVPRIKQVRLVEKNLSSLSEEPIAQVNTDIKPRERWVHDHYTWEIV
tara:strand:- start:359 stop:571 length:213 start_codon:yes stop_codon:yes gene_type:complete